MDSNHFRRALNARANLLAASQRFEELKLQAIIDLSNAEYYWNREQWLEARYWADKFKESLRALAEFYAKDAGLQPETIYESWRINKINISELRLHSVIRNEQYLAQFKIKKPATQKSTEPNFNWKYIIPDVVILLTLTGLFLVGGTLAQKAINSNQLQQQRSPQHQLGWD